MPRDDFSRKDIQRLKDRVGSHCSNPDCDVLTIAASDESNSSVNNTGIAAHICVAASGKGARRYKASMTSEQRSSIDNGIWLCASCATMIDRDAETYTEELLHQWKAQAKEKAKSRLGKKLYDQQEIDAIVQSLMAKHHLDSQTKNEQIKGLTSAVTALSQKGELGTAAIDALKNDNPSLAKELFKLETQRAEMAAKQGAEAYRNLGALAFLDNTQEALNAYRRATELAPDNVDGWNGLCELLYLKEEFNSALNVCEKILFLATSYGNKEQIAWSYGNFGLIYWKLGDLEKAIDNHEKALAINKRLLKSHLIKANYTNLACAYYSKGINYQLQEDFYNAITAYKKSLSFSKISDSKDILAVSYNNLGVVYMKLKKFNKSRFFLNKSLTLNKKSNSLEQMAQNYGNIGNLYAQEFNKKEANLCWKKSLELYEQVDNPMAKTMQNLVE